MKHFLFLALALSSSIARADTLYTSDATPMSAQIPNTLREEKTQSTRRRVAQFASDSLLPSLVVGELILLNDQRDGRNLAMRGAGAIVTTFAATELLKRAFHQKRRDRESRDSFPSGHASLSFAMASALGTLKPNYAIPAYGAAATIGLSRLELREHRPRDVIAGALLGFFIGRAFTHGARETQNTPILSAGFGW